MPRTRQPPPRTTPRSDISRRHRLPCWTKRSQGRCPRVVSRAMAAPTPSSLFLRLANTWRHLALRSDVDDIVLELLGRFSLDKIYAGAADRGAYQHLVIALLSQLKAVFDLQRLTIPSENTHVGWYLGFLASWEVALRAVEFVLQLVVEGREYLWEHRQLRDRYLAEFLLSALRVLALHPKAPTNQRARDRRERFARIHGTLEQVFDSYPGPKSFLLEVCKAVAGQLHDDPDALALPLKLRTELPTLASELVRIVRDSSLYTLFPHKVDVRVDTEIVGSHLLS